MNNTKLNSAHFHSKNSSNLSTEFSHNNNKNSRKIKKTKLNEEGRIWNIKDNKIGNQLQKININKGFLSDKRKKIQNSIF